MISEVTRKPLKGDGSITTRASDAERAVVVKAQIVTEAVSENASFLNDHGRARLPYAIRATGHGPNLAALHQNFSSEIESMNA